MFGNRGSREGGESGERSGINITVTVELYGAPSSPLPLLENSTTTSTTPAQPSDSTTNVLLQRVTSAIGAGGAWEVELAPVERHGAGYTLHIAARSAVGRLASSTVFVYPAQNNTQTFRAVTTVLAFRSQLLSYHWLKLSVL